MGTFGGGLIRFDRKKQQYLVPDLSDLIKDTSAPRYINVIKALNEEELLLGTSDEGLLIFNTRTSQIRSFFQRNKAYKAITIIRAIDKDAHGNIWVGTDGHGLLKVSNYNSGAPQIEQYVKNTQNLNSLSSNAIHAVFVDAAHNTWIGTAWNGVDVIEQKEASIHHFHSDFNGYNPSPVLAIYKDEEGTWFGTDGFGLTKYISYSFL